MTAGARRRRAALLLALALAAGGMAASRVQGRATEIERQVGPLVPVVVARSDIAAGRRIKASALAVRQVPRRFAPPDALGAPEQALGQRIGIPIARGGYVTAGSFSVPGGGDDGEAGAPLVRGQRALDVAVSGGETLEGAPPGTRVDVVVTTEPRSGGGRTFLALQDVELLGVRPGGVEDAQDAGARATAVATLRLTLRQAVYLTAAQSFAREVRLLARAPGDRRSAPPLAVGAGGL